ncbi:MAG TPA: hypothetical protein VIV57_08295 [Anaeromyxobacter sp.]
MNKHLKMVSSNGSPSPVLSHTEDIVVRSSDYSLGELEMALAISSFPPERRKNAWLLALAAPLATAGVREAIRSRFFRNERATPLALLAPALVGLAGAGVLLMTKYSRPRFRGRCA